MPAHAQLTWIAVVAVAALLCGLVLTRLRQPAIVGYIFAGVLLGPSALELVTDRGQVDTLADLGVLMLLFLVGMELNLQHFRKVWKIAVFGTLLQVAASLLVAMGLQHLFGWREGLAVVMGFCTALSSTAVAIKILEDIGELKTETGRLTVAVLIAQDFAVVPMMLFIGGGGNLATFNPMALLKMGLSVGLLLMLVLFLGRRKKMHLPFANWITSDADLRPLTGLVYCFGAAALSGMIGLSPAYGAFLAGLVIGNSAERHGLLRSTRPIQSVLMMVFFLSIGLLVDVGYIWRHLGTVLLLLAVVTLIKTMFNIAILHAFRQPWPVAFLSGVVMAQIGEFSFLLSKLAVGAHLIGRNENRLVVAVTVLSLVISPLWMITARRLHGFASYGINSLGQMLRVVFGREAGMMAATSEGTGKLLRRLRGPAEKV